jgi:hypothetical protein
MRIQHFTVTATLIFFTLLVSRSFQAQQIRIATIIPTVLQVRVGLQEELDASYPPLQTTHKITAKDICKNGGPPTKITIQRSGLAMFTGPGDGGCGGRYKDGLFTFRCGAAPKPGERLTGKEKVNLVQLEKGDKVFSSGIFVSGDFAGVGLGSCSGPQKDTLGILDIKFQFPKGYLLTASADDVEKVMSEFFTRDGIVQQQSAKLGQTIDEVVIAMGKPQEKLKASSKEIYIYKDIKITFTDGKVSGVEQNADPSSSEKR